MVKSIHRNEQMSSIHLKEVMDKLVIFLTSHFVYECYLHMKDINYNNKIGSTS
jgi:hemerythrin